MHLNSLVIQFFPSRSGKIAGANRGIGCHKSKSDTSDQATINKKWGKLLSYVVHTCVYTLTGQCFIL